MEYREGMRNTRKKPQAGWSVSQLGFKLKTSGIKVYREFKPACSVLTLLPPDLLI
jgi:hypothetical protein